MARHDQVSPNELAARSEEATKQRRRDRERRVGDDAERVPRQSQIGGVGLHDDDVSAGEPGFIVRLPAAV